MVFDLDQSRLFGYNDLMFLYVKQGTGLLSFNLVICIIIFFTN
ncbi:unnamed protein product [Arabidopsis halleri]